MDFVEDLLVVGLVAIFESNNILKSIKNQESLTVVIQVVKLVYSGEVLLI